MSVCVCVCVFACVRACVLCAITLRTPSLIVVGSVPQGRGLQQSPTFAAQDKTCACTLRHMLRWYAKRQIRSPQLHKHASGFVLAVVANVTIRYRDGRQRKGRGVRRRVREGYLRGGGERRTPLHSDRTCACRTPYACSQRYRLPSANKQPCSTRRREQTRRRAPSSSSRS